MNNILSLNQSITLSLPLSLSLLSFNIHHSFHSIWILEKRLLRTFSNADEWWRDQLKKQSIRLRASPARLSQSHCRNWRFFLLLFFWSFLLGLLNCRLYPLFSRFICYLFSKNLKIWLLTYILWVFTLQWLLELFNCQDLETVLNLFSRVSSVDNQAMWIFLLIVSLIAMLSFLIVTEYSSTLLVNVIILSDYQCLFICYVHFQHIISLSTSVYWLNDLFCFDVVYLQLWKVQLFL